MAPICANPLAPPLDSAKATFFVLANSAIAYKRLIVSAKVRNLFDYTKLMIQKCGQVLSKPGYPGWKRS
jgi:hypothetical protein